jgi:hypothetical protein
MNKAAGVRGGVLLWNKLNPTKVPVMATYTLAQWLLVTGTSRLDAQRMR